MQPTSLQLILDFASPLVDALQTAIVALVAYRLRGTSGAVASTSQAAELNSELLRRLLESNVWDQPARDPRK
jgi:hypothetical protein